MPQPTALSSEQTKQGYLGQDRQVNIQKNLEEQEKVKAGGLENIEIRKTAKQLGKDDFLQLLITQLSYQDPTAPMKDQQFIAQMAQFSSLEQMQNMASAVNKMADRQGQALIGKFIVGKDFVSGEQISGVAGAFFFDDAGDAFLKVGGRVVSVNDVVLVGDASQFKPEFGGTASAGAQQQQSRPAPRPADASLGHIQKAGPQSPAAGQAPDVTRNGEPTSAQRQAASAYESNSSVIKTEKPPAATAPATENSVQATQPPAAAKQAASGAADVERRESESEKKYPVSSEME
ncbi:MAG: flagellar hook capping FlgD N-terminal domain-containing protein [Leptospirales bacterium]|jgi:flagellar basal-body rod modification protein FlgD